MAASAVITHASTPCSRPRNSSDRRYRLRVVRKLIGKREVQKVTPDTVAKLALNMRGYSALRRVLSFAVRRGYIAENPCGKLERGERPKPNTAEVVVLPHDDLAKLLCSTTGTTRTLGLTNLSR